MHAVCTLCMQYCARAWGDSAAASMWKHDKQWAADLAWAAAGRHM
jgi:hypothetical protein